MQKLTKPVEFEISTFFHLFINASAPEWKITGIIATKHIVFELHDKLRVPFFMLNCV